jgi:hypothetical protein
LAAGAIKEVIFDIMNILDAIGNTPSIELKRVVPAGAARIVAKLEFANPTGRMKDRMARAQSGSYRSTSSKLISSTFISTMAMGTW